MNRRLLVLSSIAAAGMIAACDEQTSDLSDTVRDNAYGFQMVPQATNLPRGTVRFKITAPDSIRVDIRGLDSLGTGFWVPWVGDSLAATWVQVQGALTVVRQDTTLNALGQPDTTVTTVPVGAVSAIKNGGANQGWTWHFARATAGPGGTALAPTVAMQHFMITMEDVANPATPGSRRVIFARRGDAGLVTGARTPAVRFGNYGTTTLNEYLYSSTPARGRGYFQHQVMSVNDSTLARPPLGYYYAVYLLGELYKTSDTLFAGDLRSPWPRRNLSLYDADSIITDPEVVLDVPREIRAGALRISGDTLGLATNFPYQGYALVRLTLEAKGGIRGRMGMNRILQAPVPFLIFTGGLQ